MPNHSTREEPQVSAEQKQELEHWLRRPKTSRAMALRARIILASATGASLERYCESISDSVHQLRSSP